MNGKCPKSGEAILFVNYEPITLKGSGGDYEGVSYMCADCDSVLSVQIDPVALKSDLMKEIVAALKNKR